MPLHDTLNSRLRVFLKVTLIFTAVFVSMPAQTGQNLPGSHHSEMTSFASLQHGAGSHRRVMANVCLTDGKLALGLFALGLHHIVLGENVGAQHMKAEARYGADTYLLILDRCTGRVEDMKPGAEML